MYRPSLTYMKTSQISMFFKVLPQNKCILCAKGRFPCKLLLYPTIDFTYKSIRRIILLFVHVSVPVDTCFTRDSAIYNFLSNSHKILIDFDYFKNKSALTYYHFNCKEAQMQLYHTIISVCLQQIYLTVFQQCVVEL